MMRFAQLAAIVAFGLLMTAPAFAAAKHHGKAAKPKRVTGVNGAPDQPGMAKAGGGKVAGPSHANGSQDLGTAPK